MAGATRERPPRILVSVAEKFPVVLKQMFLSRQLWAVVAVAAGVVFIGMPALALLLVLSYQWLPGGQMAWAVLIGGGLGLIRGFALETRA